MSLLLMVFLLAALSGCATWASASPEPAASQPKLRVVSYNVALGLWLGHRSAKLSRLSRHGGSVSDLLLGHPKLRDFDVLGVQEVCSNANRWQLGALTQLGDYEVVFGRADLDRDGECKKGQAIVSRHPVLAAGTLHLPRIRSVGRSAVWADIALHHGDTVQVARVYNVHLDNRGDSLWAEEGRWKQTRHLLQHIAAWRENHPGAPLILLGDFNSLGQLYDPWEAERTIRELRARFESALKGYAQTHVLSYQLDWIFYENLTLASAGVVDVLRSDHYPIVADFVWPANTVGDVE